MKILVLIPSYNSGSQLNKVLNDLESFPELDVLVVDDGSSDDTKPIVEEKGIPVIRHQRNLGKGAALKSGFAYAAERKYDAVITMDADGQHPAASIPDFLKLNEQYPDAVLIGIRKRRPNMPLARRLSNGISAFFISIRTGRHFYDAQCGFRLLPLSCLQGKLPKRQDFIFESEMLISLALDRVQIFEIPIPTLYPAGGTTKMRYFDSTFGFIFMYITSFWKYRKWRKNEF